jgi:putative spermidine/putrescine transport system permease protein
MVTRSVTDPSAENYTRLVADQFFLRVFADTLVTAATITAVCLVLGYPYAYLMAKVSRRYLAILFAAVLVPLWTSWLVRTFAWMALLSDKGVINTALVDLGVISAPIPLIRNSFGVIVGMSYILLPFMILPLYAAMRKIDHELVIAARGLGATPAQAFWRVFVPLSAPGVLAGSVVVFVVAIGFYVTPALLGSPQNLMVGELIVNRFSEALEFGQGSAMAVVLLLVIGGLLALGARYSPAMKSMGGGGR